MPRRTTGPVCPTCGGPTRCRYVRFVRRRQALIRHRRCLAVACGLRFRTRQPREVLDAIESACLGPIRWLYPPDPAEREANAIEAQLNRLAARRRA